MGKVSGKSKKSIKSKQKLQIRGSSKYLKPVAQICSSSKASASSSTTCLDLGKKRVALLDAEKAGCSHLFQNKSGCEDLIILSPERVRFDMLKEKHLLRTPGPDEGTTDYESRLESLPMELLVKILCHLHHDQLRPVFHVSERIRTAVTIARNSHFNYTTPDRYRQEMLNTMTPLPTQHWPFLSKEDEKGKVPSLPRTPKAPKHGPRPPSRLDWMDMNQVAADLFHGSAFPASYIFSNLVPKPVCKLFPSKMVLFDEQLELCQAVAENKLR